MTRPTPDRVAPKVSPLAGLLGDSIAEERIHRIWRGTASRLERTRSRRNGIEARTRVLGGGLALASIAAALLVLGLRSEPSVLLLQSGAVPTSVVVPAGNEPGRLQFADESTIEVAPGTSLRPVENRPGQVAFALDHGRARFAITPGGPRRWFVQADRVRVEVVGTDFLVDMSDDEILVDVRRGEVRVSGAGIATGEVRLVAGASMRVPRLRPRHAIDDSDPRETLSDGARPENIRSAPEAPESSVEVPAAIERTERPANDAQRAPASQLHGSDEVPSSIIRRPTHSPDELMRQADMARQSGSPGAAVAPLTRLLRDYPSDPRAPLAALILGRLEMDVLGRPERARRALQWAQQLGVPSAFEADLSARLRRLDAQ